MAVPMLADPMDGLVSDLPFVTTHAGSQCHDAIRRVFEGRSEEHESATAVLLHLHGQAGPVLLDMVVHTVDAGPERHAVLIGREVNPDLAGLIVNQNAVVSGRSSTASWASDRCFVAEGDGGVRSRNGGSVMMTRREETSPRREKTTSPRVVTPFPSLDDWIAESTREGLIACQEFASGSEDSIRDEHQLGVGSTKAEAWEHEHIEAGSIVGSIVASRGGSSGEGQDVEISIITHQLETSASTKVQRVWRRHRAAIMSARSMAATTPAASAPNQDEGADDDDANTEYFSVASVEHCGRKDKKDRKDRKDRKGKKRSS